MAATTQIQPNAQNRYEVRRDQLPLSCPMPEMMLWNSHPRVYLPIEETGQAKCPYCGAQFHLRDAQVNPSGRGSHGGAA
ncbi:MAG: zinc-finger domain-containing protein [Candidatus Competibacteraceae bacterium]|nr:zinc-finger domain-containing protein [Candidatus Competibacteraceae bacterium]